MEIIKTAAYFLVCVECGRHGHIVCAEGTGSSEFGTVSKGLQELTTLVLAGKVAEDEALEVKRQIRTSKLPFENALLDRLIQKRFSEEDDIHGLPGEIPPEGDRTGTQKRTLN